MKREIKFRAFHKSQIIYNINLSVSKGIHYFFDGKDILLDVPLMQWTGLKDKNGKDIYEGDIIIMGHDEKKQYPRIIEWKNHGFWCKQIRGEGNFPLTFTNAMEKYCDETDWEIIGNIYKNPEFLTVRGGKNK